jgi:serine/threonine protein kinase
LHRDIKPSNVFIRENGTPVLLDFGSARTTNSDSRSMTAIVSPGYAPLEQYSKDGHQGPWSDIYALAGVMYRAITGESPPDAVMRLKSDTVPQQLGASRTRYSERFLKAVEWGLMTDEKMRPQTVADWREVFLGRVSMTALNRGPVSLPQTAQPLSQRVNKSVPSTVKAVSVRHTAARAASGWKWVAGLGVGLVLVAIAVAYINTTEINTTEAPDVVPQAPAPVKPPVVVPNPVPSPAPAAVEPNASAANAAATPDIPLRVRREFAVIDRDGDGYLSPEELQARAPRLARHLAEVDTDGDGRISLDEFWQVRKKIMAARPSAP